MYNFCYNSDCLNERLNTIIIWRNAILDPWHSHGMLYLHDWWPAGFGTCCAPAQQPLKIIISSNKIPFCLMKCLNFKRDKFGYWKEDFSLATDWLKFNIYEQPLQVTLDQWNRCLWITGLDELWLGRLIYEYSWFLCSLLSILVLHVPLNNRHWFSRFHFYKY